MLFNLPSRSLLPRQRQLIKGVQHYVSYNVRQCIPNGLLILPKEMTKLITEFCLTVNEFIPHGNPKQVTYMDQGRSVMIDNSSSNAQKTTFSKAYEKFFTNTSVQYEEFFGFEFLFAFFMFFP